MEDFSFSSSSKAYIKGSFNMGKKYSLSLVSGGLPIPGISDMYMIRAKRDIPRFGVKKGDYGGYVNSRKILSHEGDCWIGYGAAVYGRVTIAGNAYVADKAIVMNKGFKKDTQGYTHTIIEGNSAVMENAYLKDVRYVTGNAVISGSAKVIGACEISGNAKISGLSLISRAAEVIGDSELTYYSRVFLGATVENNRVVRGEAIIMDSDREYTPEVRIPAAEKPMVAPSPENSPKAGTGDSNLNTLQKAEINDAINLLGELNGEVSSYETDIVKIIQYPVMVDKTNSYTLEMIQARKLANRLVKSPEHPKFIHSVFDFERKFISAESNAIKLASSLLSEPEQKKVSKAKDLLALASNDSATEQEKKASFLQGFKQLEGIIAVPEEAVEAFRIKYNLKEIEA
jgi:carbonic anhydrase/acetyltransferase-like protein (isoleucine patch superfamily)